MTRPSRSALIVSDSAPLRRYAVSSLKAIRFSCAEAINGFHAMDRLYERLFDIYVIDLDQQTSDGMSIFAITLFGGLRDPSPVVIGISSRTETEARKAPWNETLNLAALIPKPFRPNDLIAAADAVLADHAKGMRAIVAPPYDSG
jgi:DNA-binding response OmpR family regulator